MRAEKSKKSRRLLLILCAALTLASGFCFLLAMSLGRELTSQQEAERWQGDSEQSFRQVSCFVPVDERLQLNRIYEFRSEVIKRLRESVPDAENPDRLYVDAWSCTGKALASTDLGKGDASVIAVGGSFFQFHPLRLMSGSYIQESDLMKDRVLLDEDLAWLLFGGTELQGLSLKINGVPFVVSGVVQREQDFASRQAYTAGMGLYMSYDAWKQLEENAGVTAYELVMAEPVKGFMINFVREKFPIGQGQIVENTGRYAMDKMLLLVTQFGTRSMQKLGVLLPYWENAARCMEDWCALLDFLGWLLILTPMITALVYLRRLLRRIREALTERIFPTVKDGAEEIIRRGQRKRWEKKHGRHEA